MINETSIIIEILELRCNKQSNQELQEKIVFYKKSGFRLTNFQEQQDDFVAILQKKIDLIEVEPVKENTEGE